MDKKAMLEQMIEHYYSGNQRKFGEQLGLSPQAISTWKQRGTFNAELIYEHFDDISAEWLLSGKGSMIKEPTYDFDPEKSLKEQFDGLREFLLTNLKGYLREDD